MIPSGILVDPVIWPQLTWAENWGVVPFFLGRGLASHLAQCGLAEACLHAKCYLYPSSRLVVIDMGRKLGDCAPLLFFWGELSPHLVQCGLGRSLSPYQVAS